MGAATVGYSFEDVSQAPIDARSPDMNDPIAPVEFRTWTSRAAVRANSNDPPSQNQLPGIDTSAVFADIPSHRLRSSPG
jgi:hypothetical protein